MWSHPKLTERYEILEQLGEGDGTRVMRARSRNVPRDFAVKVFTFEPGRSGERARERARREGEAPGKLQHSHLVTLFEVVELDANSLALVMDYIEGVRVDRYIARNGPLSIRKALELAEQLATALHEGHRIKLIHRDVRPENMIVRGLASGDLFVHLFDYGIVRGPAPSSLTQGFLGRPEFASPEQSRGGEVDARTDVFGLGATLFFLLTGEPPFEDTVWEAMLEREFDEPPDLREMSDMPEAINAFVHQMMANDPDDRPTSMKAVAARLRELEAYDFDEFDEGLDSARVTTFAESPPVLMVPAQASEITDATNGWDAERVTELTIGPHVISTRESSIAFLDQNLDIHVIDPERGLRRDVAVELEEAPKALEPWRGGILALMHDGSVDGWNWDGARRSVREADPQVCALGAFADGRAILGMKNGECLVEQPNGTWRSNRAGRREIEVIAATRDAVAISTRDGAMLVSALSFDVPLRHLGGRADAIGFSSDSYLLAIARDGAYVIQSTESRSIISQGSLPAGTRRVAFFENQLCAYLIDEGQLLRFRLS